MAVDIRAGVENSQSTLLSKREIEVLSLVMEGLSSKEIADVLFCGKRTVDFHLDRIYKKLQVSNRVQAMQRAMMLGIVSMKHFEKTVRA